MANQTSSIDLVNQYLAHDIPVSLLTYLFPPFFFFLLFLYLPSSLFPFLLSLTYFPQVGAINIDSSWQTGYNSLLWNTKLYPNAYFLLPSPFSSSPVPSSSLIYIQNYHSFS